MSMKKDRHKMTPQNIVNKFPTISQFKKIIDPIINTKKVEPKIGPPKPILPEYLKEMPSEGNPFTIVKSRKIQDLKDGEKERRDFDLKKIKDFPISEALSRDTRIRYNASYQTKLLKYKIDMNEIMEELNNPTKNEFESEVPKSKFMSNYDYIVDKRKICLLDLAVDIKEDQLNKLEEIVLEEEKYIKSENERLQKERDEHDQYLKNICQRTSDAIKLAEKETAKKNKVSEKVKRARYNMAHLNAECVKLEEEYLRLKTYKEFLRNCQKQQLRKQALERTSLMNELKIDAILKEVELDKNSFQSYDSAEEEERLNHYKAGLKNRENNNASNNYNRNSSNDETIKNRVITLNKEELAKMKVFIINGSQNFNNESDTPGLTPGTSHGHSNSRERLSIDEENKQLLDENDLDDDAIFFDGPQDLVNILSELEANNLSLIENVQEQEEMCDQMRQRILNIKTEMNEQIAMIDKHILKERNKIVELEESINCIKETEIFLGTFNDLERYKKIFYFGDLSVTTPDEMMNYLHDKITILYNSVFEKVDSTKSNTVEMLKRIESLVDSLYIELQSYGKSSILKAKKIVDEKKREAARIKQKEMCKEAEQMKIRKAMEKAKMPPRYQRGRRIVYRSDPPKEKIKAEKIDWDEVRLQEENAYFFT